MNAGMEQGLRKGWKTFEHLMRKKLQSLKAKRSTENDLSADRYVYDLLERSLKRLQSSRFSGITYESFETHRSVIVRAYLPDLVEPRSISLEIAPLQVYIDGIPGKGKERIRLPAPVSPKRYKADYKDGILEITLVKQSEKRKRGRVRSRRRKEADDR